jgi:ABC-2 type transport system ATP-binding protein
MAILSFTNVSKKYVGAQALDNVSCNIQKNSITGIVGSNGAGKTSFIKVALGLVVPEIGEVYVNGFKPSKRNNEFLKSVGFVSGQIQLLDPHVPVIDSIRVSALFKAINLKTIDEKILDLSKRLNIDHILEKPARSLSLGERIKSEIIAGIIHDPKILFLDEPTIGLDFQSQEEMHYLLNELNRNLGITIIITSHYFEDIKNTCSRLIFLDQGKSLYEGDIDVSDTVTHPDVLNYLKKLKQA